MAYNFGRGAQGAVQGGTTGSMFGPVGAGIGSILGALGGFGGGKKRGGGGGQDMLGFTRGAPKGFNRLPTVTPGQAGLLQSILGQTQGMQQGGYGQANDILSQYLNPESDIYKNFEDPYMRQFQEQTLPGIAEQYAGKGALSSSGFGQALGAAGGGLQESLAQLKTTLQRSAIESLFGQHNKLAELGLGTNAFQYTKKPQSGGFLSNLFGSAAGNSDFQGSVGNGLSNILGFGQQRQGAPVKPGFQGMDYSNLRNMAMNTRG